VNSACPVALADGTGVSPWWIKEIYSYGVANQPHNFLKNLYATIKGNCNLFAGENNFGELRNLGLTTLN